MVGTHLRAILALFAVALLAASAPPPPPAKLVVGQPAPDFKLRLMNGKSVRLSELRGKVVVLNLWASWCGPCKIEMPTLDLMQVNGNPHGLEIYGLQVMDSAPKSSFRKLQAALNYPLAFHISERDYEPIGGAVPSNYIIDRKGVLRYARAAALNKQSFAELLVPLLNEAP